ncbi:unnamed protein product [Rotaria sordida]|uniref:Uncharacterized protein n=1 Tax=Rotaria sordida TaxID=392033 RepID=A0A814RTL0_9BILA|nr:unnamed protein product [Rotaria sordida]
MPPQEIGKLWDDDDRALFSYDGIIDFNNHLNNVVHPRFYLFIRAIQNDYAYKSAISSRHPATGILSPRKKLFVNRNARLHNLEEHFI